MKWIALIAVLAFWTAQVFAEEGNYLLGPLEQAEAATIDVRLAGLTVAGIKLGMSEKEVEKVIRKQRRNDSWRPIASSDIKMDCEERSGARWCALPKWATAGFKLPVITRFVADSLVGVFYGAPQGGPVRYDTKRQLAEYAQDIADQIPPTQSDTDSMTWQGENIVVSIDWGAGKMMYIDTSAGIEQ